MQTAYTRPFRPLDLEERAGAMFSLPEMIEQLRCEEVYRAAGRNALTLVHDEGLASVLVVARRGAACEDHCSPRPTLFLVLDGSLQIDSEEGTVALENGSAAVLAADIRHHLIALGDCAYLIVLGSAPDRDDLRRAAGSEVDHTDPAAGSGSEESENRAVARATHRLVAAIDAARPLRREELRAYARDLLAADVGPSAPVEGAPLPPLGFAAFALSFAAASLVFLFFLPPVAAVLFLLAIAIALAGFAYGIASRGARVGERILRAGMSHVPPLRHRRAH